MAGARCVICGGAGDDDVAVRSDAGALVCVVQVFGVDGEFQAVDCARVFRHAVLYFLAAAILHGDTTRSFVGRAD